MASGARLSEEFQQIVVVDFLKFTGSFFILVVKRK